MSAAARGGSGLALAALPALLAIAAAMAMAVEARLPFLETGFSFGDSLGRLIGSAEEGIGDTLFVKADLYFHGGAMEEGDAPAAAPDDWIARINSRIQPTEHRHLETDEQKEMLPFFAMATKLDPRNIEAVLTTAYWLNNRFGKTDEAIGVLQKGERDNPLSWEIPFELGSLYLKEKKDYSAAARYYEEAIARSEGVGADYYYRVDMHYFLAEALSELGRPGEALEYYRRALTYYPPGIETELKGVIAAKIRSLTEDGARPQGETNA